ncbi:MAG: RNA polymerase sigma factor, partial [Planctomycetota bacterium]
TCVVNRARNWNRSRQRQTTNLDETESEVSNTNRPEQWIIYSEQLRQLNNALAQLPYEQREVIILYLQGGMKFKTISESQGVSINTVQSRYRYGLDKLRSILDSEAKL